MKNILNSTLSLRAHSESRFQDDECKLFLSVVIEWYPVIGLADLADGRHVLNEGKASLGLDAWSAQIDSVLMNDIMERFCNDR